RRHDETVAALLETDPTRRPSDAFTARKLLTGLKWPSTVEPAAPHPRRERMATDRPSAARVVVRDGVTIDAWTGRAIECVRLTEATRERATAFARAGHPCLQL